jgi:Sortase domain
MSKVGWAAAGAAVGALLVAAGVNLLFGISAPNAPERALAEATQSTTSASTLRPVRNPETSSTADSSMHQLFRPQCRSSTGAFVPTMVSITQITHDANVLAVNRDVSNTPGVPPVTETGKREFAWDAGGAMPGSLRGNVNLNAHTWPDGTALGNALLRELSAGDVIVVQGAHGQRQCYKVIGQREVAITHVPQAVLDRYYDSAGPPQLTVLACSGTRLGPGNWTHRTLWYATPVGSVAALAKKSSEWRSTAAASSTATG